MPRKPAHPSFQLLIRESLVTALKIYDAAVFKAHFQKLFLHRNIISVSVDPQIRVPSEAFLKAEIRDPATVMLYGYAVDNRVRSV